MKGEIKASLSAIAAAVMLVACASKGPVNATGAAPADAGAQDQTSAEYQQLIDNASEQRICKRQSVTGSRIDSMVCLTRAEMEEQRKRADEVMRDIRESAAMSRQTVQDRPQMPSPPPPSNP
jgi:hypothetical protein